MRTGVLVSCVVAVLITGCAGTERAPKAAPYAEVRFYRFDANSAHAAAELQRHLRLSANHATAILSPSDGTQLISDLRAIADVRCVQPFGEPPICIDGAEKSGTEVTRSATEETIAGSVLRLAHNRNGVGVVAYRTLTGGPEPYEAGIGQVQLTPGQWHAKLLRKDPEHVSVVLVAMDRLVWP